VQRVLLVRMPLSLLVTGFLFPVGVLLYSTVNNLWTLGQQRYVLRRFLPAGPPAARPDRRKRPATSC
jgi:YidC/Oxa1 family membrane protein insertase